MPEVRVVAHDVPEHRAVPMGVIGLGSDWLSARMRMPESAAEQDDLHVALCLVEDLELRQGDDDCPPTRACRPAAR